MLIKPLKGGQALFSPGVILIPIFEHRLVSMSSKNPHPPSPLSPQSPNQHPWGRGLLDISIIELIYYYSVSAFVITVGGAVFSELLFLVEGG